MTSKLGTGLQGSARRHTWRLVLREGVLAALATWFAVVAITAVPNLRPSRIQPRLPSGQDAYLDDFGVFYAAGTLLREGQGRFVYRLDSLHAAEARTFRVNQDDFQALPFFNPPHALLIFAPLSLLNLPTSAAVWLVGTLILGATGLWLLQREYPLRLGMITNVTVVLGLISSLAFYQVAVHGQISFLLVFGLCLLYTSMRSNHAGLSVPGLLILSLKPQLLLLPVLLLLAQRRYRELAFATLGGTALLGAILVIIGPHVLPDYIHLLVSSTSWEGENGVSTQAMFGWVGLLSGITGGEAGAARRLVGAVLAAITILGAGWLIYRGTRRGYDPARLLSAAIVAGLLASPHFYAQDLILVMPALLVALHGAERRWEPAILAVIGWFVLYIHFTVLGTTSINLTTIYLVGLLCWLIFESIRRVGPRPTARAGAGPHAGTAKSAGSAKLHEE